MHGQFMSIMNLKIFYINLLQNIQQYNTKIKNQLIANSEFKGLSKEVSKENLRLRGDGPIPEGSYKPSWDSISDRCLKGC